MAGSTFGTLFRVSTWGESHGAALGAVIDGCPAGLELSEADIQPFLDRRKPGQNRFTTARAESDTVEILSGVFEGKTTGTPISLMIRNKDQRSKDYGNISEVYRPAHADITFDGKYGLRDYRGGGRSSGRETIGRVCAGAIASKVLAQMGIKFTAFASSVGPVVCDAASFDRDYLEKESALYMPDREAERKAREYLDECIKSQDSSGGTVEVLIDGCPVGLGETVFDKLDALLGQAIFSIGAVKAVEIGDGTAVARAKGSENNDAYTLDGEGKPLKATNHAGGILGGMSDGSQIRVRASIKPTPSIARDQNMLCRDGSVQTVSIHGRHDPVIVPRAVVVVESMCAITILDLLLRNMGARMDRVAEFYSKN